MGSSLERGANNFLNRNTFNAPLFFSVEYIKGSLWSLLEIQFLYTSPLSFLFGKIPQQIKIMLQRTATYP